jgi:hypothetical protein
VVVWLTMVSDPRSLVNMSDVNEQARRTAELNPPLAFITVAAFAASRFVMASDLHRTSHGPGELQFPRDRLMERPVVTRTKPEVLARCIDLVEAMVRSDPSDDALRATLLAGPTAFTALGGIAVQLGQLVVDLDPTLEGLADLIAREGVTAEREYLEGPGMPQ